MNYANVIYWGDRKGVWVQESMRRKGEDMRSLEKWLRHLVESKGWDYCVVWKLGDDPSRFIELVGCICGVCGNVKVEEEEKILGLSSLCRDTNFQHPIRSKACEALAQFPAFMSLYAGVHGEVVISNKPMWLTAADASADSEPSNEGVGTRVLVPISGGLIELFASKHIPKDQNMLELVSTQIPKDQNMLKLVSTQCNALESVKSETMTPQSSTNVSINEQVLDPLLEENMQKVPLSFHSSIVIPDAKPIANLSLVGTSMSSNISADSLSLQIVPKQMIKSTGTKRASSNENVPKQGAASVFVSDKKSAKDNAKVPRSRERHRYHSKNLETERKRRNRIKDSLFTLRSLVPNITKMDRAAIVGDAIDYIKELESDERKLRQELKELEDEEEREQEKINAKLKSRRLDKVKKTNNSGLSNTTEIEVQVEVNQLTKREFLIVVLCEQKKGGFRRLMEALNDLSIRVIDANVTSLDGKMRNTLKVEANKDLQPKKLRDQLIKLISMPTESPTSRK